MLQEDYKYIVATTASICTILQFLTGTLVCLKIVKNNSTGDISSFPFVSGLLSTSLWLKYGFFLQDLSMIVVNIIGAILFSCYVLVFLAFSIKKSTVIRQFLVCLIFLATVLLYIHNLTEFDEAKRTLGIICCIVTILFFAAPLASFLHVLRVKNTDSLPFPIIFASFVVSMQWLMYGAILRDRFVQIPNFLGCVLSGFQLTLFCIFPRVPKGYSNELV